MKQKYFTTEANIYPTTIRPKCIETEISELRSEIAQLSYLIKQSSSQQTETQAISRRAEARAYIIENKLMDIQRHVVKIPAVLEQLPNNLRQYLRDKSPTYISDALRRVNESRAASLLTNKYAVWAALGGAAMFWQYRQAMYRRTSEEVANVAALTLQQDSLRETIQETLAAVANSPETLASLSALFQKLIGEARTEQVLIDLIVRALNSPGVCDAAVYLLDLCFQNPDLQGRAGEFLKVAANATVLDEGVQQNAGVGMQRALTSMVVPAWATKLALHAKKPDGNDGGGALPGNGGDGRSPGPSEDKGGGSEEEGVANDGGSPGHVVVATVGDGE